MVVARDFLWVTAWFPFWLITTAYNLEYVIPLQTITAVKPARFLGFKSILITYTDKRAHPRTVRLYPRNREQFLHAIGRTRTGAAPA